MKNAIGLIKKSKNYSFACTYFSKKFIFLELALDTVPILCYN